jgi:hypothetical protein
VATVDEGSLAVDIRLDRVSALTGAGFTVLYFIGFGLIGEISETATPSGSEVVELLSAHPLQTMVGAYLSLLSLVLLLWFVGRLRSTLREWEGSTGRLSATAFSGGSVVAAVLAVGFIVIGQAAARADSAGGLSPEVGIVFYDLYRSALVASAVGFAVLIGATAVIAFRSSEVPGWLAWISAVVAIGLITPVGFFFVLLALFWVLVASIWLFARSTSSPETQTDYRANDDIP